MDRLSPGMADGSGRWLISSMSRVRARAMRGLGGSFEGDGDGGGGEVDDAGQAADDGLAGDGAVFVIVAQVGVQPVGEPVLGVVREQPEYHLQAAPPGAQHRDLGAGVELVPSGLTA
jgi:hypothetical protein